MNELAVMNEQVGIWRCIVERSSMSNNDEVVFHRDHEVTRDLVRGLVLSRPVFAVEIEAGFDPAYEGDRHDEQSPDITRTLDGLYRFVADVEFRLHAWRKKARTVTKIVTDIVAYSYYDCMSGGMDRTCVLACRAIIQRYNCDLDTPVYPGRKGSARGNHDGECVGGWYTLGGWMCETERPGADESFEKKVGHLLGPLTRLLPPHEGVSS